MEWRLVGIPKGIPEIKYRAGRDGVIPYSEFPIPDNLYFIEPRNLKFFPDDCFEGNELKPVEQTTLTDEEYDEMLSNEWSCSGVPEPGGINYIDTIIIGPTLSFERQKYVLEDMIKQKAHKIIYPELLTIKNEDVLKQEDHDLSHKYLLYHNNSYLKFPNFSRT